LGWVGREWDGTGTGEWDLAGTGTSAAEWLSGSVAQCHASLSPSPGLNNGCPCSCCVHDAAHTEGSDSIS
jgi:hypothetical protein